MGGEGSGRKPDIVRKILNEIRTPIASSGGEGVFIPNYSGLKDSVRKTCSGGEVALLDSNNNFTGTNTFQNSLSCGSFNYSDSTKSLSVWSGTAGKISTGTLSLYNNLASQGVLYNLLATNDITTTSNFTYTASTDTLDVGNYTGTWAGDTISIAKGGTNNDSFTSGKYLKYSDTTTFTDSSSTAYTVVNNGSVTQVTGKVSTGAGDFSASNDLYVSHNSAFKSNTQSVAFWFKPDVINSYQGLVTIYTSNADSFEVFISQTNAQLVAGNYGWQVNSATSSIATGTWYHVVLTFSSGAVELYLNGSSVDTGTGSTYGGSSNTANFIIGARPGSSYRYNGQIDDVRLFTKVLSSSEVTTLYNSGNGTTSSINSDEKIWVKFDDSVIPKVISATYGDADLKFSTFSGELYDTTYSDILGVVSNGLITEWYYI